MQKSINDYPIVARDPMPVGTYQEQLKYIRSIGRSGDSVIWSLYLSPALTLAQLIEATGYPAGATSSALGFLTAWKIVIHEDRGLLTTYRLNHAVRRRLYPFAGRF
jgi:hypothetical protein